MVGKFGAPHGVRGEVRILSFTGDPLAIAGYGELTDATGKRRFLIESARIVKANLLVAQISGIKNRNDSETLTNLEIFAGRAALPPPDEDEFYLADLEGLEARLVDGSYFGRVSRLENHGAGDILVVTRPDNSEELVSFTRINVPQVFVAEGYLVIHPPQSVDAREKSAPDSL